ncbi:MAG TPA: heme exporter protein CcmB [Rhizomicrobium sp.]|jgi:heme exporter protein B|nr:heme exporter protein CcmB [Rhizomicrobium sp.]
MSPFLVLLWRDVKLATRSGGGAALALCFFALVATLVPLGIGADLKLLARVAGGILWVGAVLAALLSLDRLFQADYDDGSLELIALAPLPLELTSFAKILAHWLSTGLPLTVMSPLLAQLFNLSPDAMPVLVLSLLMGTPAVSAIGAIGAALTVSLRGGGLILPLIILPLLSPAVIFGAGAVAAGLDGFSPAGALGLLGAFSLAAVLLSPFAAAASVRLNLSG